ncbi:hypothetical protein [Streptomyces sp. SD15]
MATFDHRIVVLVSVKGLRTDCELFEEACARHGWAILEKPPHPSGCELSTMEYTVEIRLPGTYGGAVRGSRLQVERVARQFRLDLHVRVAERLESDSKGRPRWRVYIDPAARPVGFTPVWARSRIRRAVVLFGLRDTGRELSAENEAEALILARRALPGSAPVPPGIRVRSLSRKPERPRAMRRGNQIVWGRLFYLIFAGALSAVMLGYALNHENAVGTMLSILALVWVGAGFAVVLLRRGRQHPESWRREDSVLLVVGVLLIFPTAFANGVSGTDSDVWPGVFFVLGLLCLRGLYLFIRQRSWRTWMPWVLPALLPFAFGTFPGVGSFVHVTYLDVFGVGLADVDVPAYWQLFAALRWGPVVLVLLVGPALYGYIRHSHRPGEDRALFGVLLALLLIAAAIGAGEGFVIGQAHDAGVEARRAAASGDTPAPYYGVEPEWVCVSPVTGTQPGEIPVQGGDFTPTRSYLMLGDSGGTVVLWDPGTRKSLASGHALKLPLDQLRIAPTPHPDRSCA